jgi:hypothetical protein
MSTLRQENKKIYWAWKAMKQRCCNPRCQAFRNYGARGITVCKEWESFEPFCRWAIENGYAEGLELDRIDNEKGYSPENCRWISRRKNINNRRNTTLLTVNGVTRPRTEWEKIAGISPGTVKAWVITHSKEYAEKRIQEALINGYTGRDFGYSHRRAVIHVETGKRFESVREAANAFGLAPCTISNAMRDKRATGKGRFVMETI